MKVSEKVPVDDDYFYETYGIPKPKNYDKLKAKMEGSEKKIEPEKPKTAPEKTTSKDKQEVEEEKENLIDVSQPTVVDKLFQKLSDFFDQARH